MSLFLLVPRGDWPKCLYDPEKQCGAPETRSVYAGPSDVELVRRGWHVADMCDCPSCPLRVEINRARFVSGV